MLKTTGKLSLAELDDLSIGTGIDIWESFHNYYRQEGSLRALIKLENHTRRLLKRTGLGVSLDDIEMAEGKTIKDEIMSATFRVVMENRRRRCAHS